MSTKRDRPGLVRDTYADGSPIPGKPACLSSRPMKPGSIADLDGNGLVPIGWTDGGFWRYGRRGNRIWRPARIT